MNMDTPTPDVPTPDVPNTGDHPVHAYRCTGPAKRSRIRRLGAARQRALRQRRKEAGRPSPEALDRAIVDALREMLMRHEDSLRRPIDPALLLGLTKTRLLLSAHREQAFEGKVPAERSKAIIDTMRDRLLT